MNVTFIMTPLTFFSYIKSKLRFADLVWKKNQSFCYVRSFCWWLIFFSCLLKCCTSCFDLMLTLWRFSGHSYNDGNKKSVDKLIFNKCLLYQLKDILKSSMICKTDFCLDFTRNSDWSIYCRTTTAYKCHLRLVEK